MIHMIHTNLYKIKYYGLFTYQSEFGSIFNSNEYTTSKIDTIDLYIQDNDLNLKFIINNLWHSLVIQDKNIIYCNNLKINSINRIDYDNRITNI